MPQDSKVVLDLSHVSRIDGSGLGGPTGELMRLHTHLARGSGALKLVNPSRNVVKIMRATRIDSVLDACADEDAGFRSFE